MDAAINLRFMFFYPGEFGGSKITRGIEKMRKTKIFTKPVQCCVAIFHRPAVAPYY
jgi:hypothetical protein